MEAQPIVENMDLLIFEYIKHKGFTKQNVYSSSTWEFTSLVLLLAIYSQSKTKIKPVRLNYQPIPIIIVTTQNLVNIFNQILINQQQPNKYLNNLDHIT